MLLKTVVKSSCSPEARSWQGAGACCDSAHLFLLRHSCSISPAACCHHRGSLCPNLAQPYPTPQAVGRRQGHRSIFWRSSLQRESSRSGVAAFQVIDGPGRLLAHVMLWCCQAQCSPHLILAQVPSLGPIAPAPAQSGWSPTLPATTLPLPWWHWHLECV